MKITLLIIVLLVILWSLYGYFGSRVEHIEYTVLKKENGYEIRDYPDHIVAQTIIKVSGSSKLSMSKGFNILADYIFGNNTKKQNISMTSPVLMQENFSEKITMTAPVITENKNEIMTISFVMPKNYTIDTLPTPLDSKVSILEIPRKKIAVIRFTGYRAMNRIQSMEDKLLTLLSVDGIEVIGKPFYAGYNPPWTPPWMTRNEILVEIK